MLFLHSKTTSDIEVDTMLPIQYTVQNLYHAKHLEYKPLLGYVAGIGYF